LASDHQRCAHGDWRRRSSSRSTRRGGHVKERLGLVERHPLVDPCLPYFALAAACFDASENVALLLTLGGHGGSFASPFATVCSGIKWMLISIAILYALCGLALLLRVRMTSMLACRRS
jgi:hypothetical protein